MDMISRICPSCLLRFERFPSQISISIKRGSKNIYCSRKCMGKDPQRIERMRNLGYANLGKRGFKFKNRPGFYINSSGYKLLFKPEHTTSGKDGYIMEHRWIMENHINRLLNKNEKVHHLDGNRLNNKIENLELCESQSSHMKKHKGLGGKFVSYSC